RSTPCCIAPVRSSERSRDHGERRVVSHTRHTTVQGQGDRPLALLVCCRCVVMCRGRVGRGTFTSQAGCDASPLLQSPQRGVGLARQPRAGCSLRRDMANPGNTKRTASSLVTGTAAPKNKKPACAGRRSFILSAPGFSSRAIRLPRGGRGNSAFRSLADLAFRQGFLEFLHPRIRHVRAVDEEFGELFEAGEFLQARV